MRPPMQSAAAATAATPLQSHESTNSNNKQQQQHNLQHTQQQQHQQQQQQQLQQALYTPATVTDLNLHAEASRNRSKPKSQQREYFVVEQKLNFACATAVETPRLPARDNSAVQLLELSTSPPTPDASLAYAAPRVDVLRCSLPPAYSASEVIESSAVAKRASTHSSSDYASFSRSSSSEDDGSGSYSGERSSRASLYARNCNFDDVAEHFIINFPADSPAHNPADCIVNLPLSETEPLLSNIETAAYSKRALCLNKNNGSLIFTRKELPPAQATSSTTPTALSSNNNQSTSRQSSKSIFSTQRTAAPPAAPPQRRHYSERNRKQTKHLPATYHQQQRRSLQLNYNNNLVTTSTCGGANNNYCCASKATTTTSSGVGVVKSAINTGNSGGVGTGAGAGNVGGVGGGGVVLHKHHSALNSPGVLTNTTTAATTRKQHAYSWYAPVYSALEEELEQDSRDSSPIHNLANAKKHHANHHYQQKHHEQQQHQQQHINYNNSATASSTVVDNETVALLETRNQINIQVQLHPPLQTHWDGSGSGSGNGGTGPVNATQQPKRINNSNKNNNNSSRQTSTPTPNSLPLLLPHQSSHTVNVLTNNFAASATAKRHSSGGGGGGSGRSSGEFSNVTAVSSGYDSEGPHAGSLGLAGGPLPRRRRFENFLKSLVGLKPTRNTAATDAALLQQQQQQQQQQSALQLPASPEITITRTPSEQNVVVLRDPAGRVDRVITSSSNSNNNSCGSNEKLANIGIGSTSSLNVVQQKLRNMMRREGSATSLNHQPTHSIVQYNGMRKCETVLALTRQQSNSLCSPMPTTTTATAMTTMLPQRGSGIFSASGVEQIRPLNRLRNSMASISGVAGTCSRCSSLLSLAASGSRYSLNTTANSVCSNGAAIAQQQQQQQHKHQHQRNSNNLSCNNLSGSGSNRQQTNNNHNNNSNSMGTNNSCSRKSSAGASSLSPPSNVTTATLNSSLTPSSTITPPISPTTPTCSTPTAAHKQFANAAATDSMSTSAGIFISFPASASSSTAPTAGVASHPLTVTSLLDTHEQAVTSSEATATASATKVSTRPFEIFTCKLCLIDVENASDATTLQLCGCRFCTECMRAYVEFEISEAAYEISCPDAQCPVQGIMTLPEIANLTTANLMKKHHRYRLNREIELDKSRTWCPRAGCETVCRVGITPHGDAATASTSSSSAQTSASISPVGGASDGITPFLCAVQCPSCKDEFCSACKKTWHPNMTCEENSRRLVADGQDDIGIPFDNDLIKCCPMCAVPIEKDEGCAQMMCKRCKHVFCWYCLASLDDDFLLRHYDKGPCKNKLGHSRASVVWHRAQVIGIFAGFGILLLVASPLLLLAAPCIICCKCRICSGSKIDEGDGDLDEATALQS